MGEDSGGNFSEEEDTEEQSRMHQIKKQIDQIESKIAKTGGVSQCGWDPADHKDFLRIKTKHKDKMTTVAFLTDMRRAVPMMDEDEVQ